MIISEIADTFEYVIHDEDPYFEISAFAT